MQFLWIPEIHWDISQNRVKDGNGKVLYESLFSCHVSHAAASAPFRLIELIEVIPLQRHPRSAAQAPASPVHG